jgi:hypothetical protein
MRCEDNSTGLAPMHVDLVQVTPQNEPQTLMTTAYSLMVAWAHTLGEETANVTKGIDSWSYLEDEL